VVPDRWTAGNDPHLRGLPDRGDGGGGNHAGNPVAGIRSSEPVPADGAADVSSGEVPAWDQLNGFTSTRNRKAQERVPLRYLVVARSSSGSPFRSHLPPGRLIRNDVGLAGVTRQAGHQGICGVEVRGDSTPDFRASKWRPTAVPTGVSAARSQPSGAKYGVLAQALEADHPKVSNRSLGSC
jgi:hypothetical protein